MDFILYLYYSCIALIILGIVVCWFAYVYDTTLSGKSGKLSIAGLIAAILGLCGWVATTLFIFKDLT